MTSDGPSSEDPERVRALESSLDEDEFSTMLEVISAAKEIVFSTDGGDMILTPIAWVRDAETDFQILRPVMSAVTEHREVLTRWLTVATLFDVPVVPNEPHETEELGRLFDEMMENGFDVIDGERRLKFRTEALALSEGIRQIAQPAEFHLLSARLEAARAENATAKTAISSLTTAITSMEQLLRSDARNENALQRCITQYPAFFGPSYVRVIPKHRLGSEYEVDYALELVDGSVDVVEIEASTHPLYTKTGNPTSALVHAEQQVLDWLAWLDANSAYARARLEGVRRPCGLVVIGTRASLKPGDAERLRWRNLAFGGRLTILTFDDLVARCRALRALLVAEAAHGGGDVTTEPGA